MSGEELESGSAPFLPPGLLLPCLPLPTELLSLFVFALPRLLLAMFWGSLGRKEGLSSSDPSWTVTLPVALLVRFSPP